MTDYKSFLEELKVQDQCPDQAWLLEAAMQFGGRTQSQFGNILILAGGAGSGKGFTLGNLVDLEGKVLDVDAVKSLALKAPNIRKQVEKDLGKDYLEDDALKDPEKVTRLHLYLSDEKNLIDKRQLVLFDSIVLAHPDRKPNLIFDITLKDLTKLVNLSAQFKDLGYDPKKIHLLWVVNSFEVAKRQNAQRSRSVSEKILVQTHTGASYSMKQVIDGSFDLRGMVESHIYINFNQAKVDSDVVKSSSGGSYIKKGSYIRIKEAGKPIDRNKVNKAVIAKIKEYVPNPDVWNSLGLNEATNYSKEEELARAKEGPFKDFLSHQKIDGWYVRGVPHALSQLMERYPNYTKQTLMTFSKKLVKWMNTKNPRFNKMGEEVMFFDNTLKMMVNVDLQKKELRFITSLEMQAKPFMKDGKRTKMLELVEGVFCQVIDLDEE